MGHGASIESSNMEGFVETEFQRVKRDPERSYLVRPPLLQRWLPERLQL